MSEKSNYQQHQEPHDVIRNYSRVIIELLKDTAGRVMRNEAKLKRIEEMVKEINLKVKEIENRQRAELSKNGIFKTNLISGEEPRRGVR